METITPLEIKQLRTRFISDYNLPLQLVASPYFEERLKLCEEDYEAETRYNELLKLIDERFDGNPNKFLEYYHSVRDNIITCVSHSDAFKEFNSNKEFVKDIKPICSKRNLYTNEQDGGLFISYDMKQANFQTLKYVNPAIVCDCETYRDFIGKFTDLDYIKDSKYTRQVIFGKMNPSRTIKLELWITNEFAKTLDDLACTKHCELFSLNNDEIILKWNGTEEEFDKIEIVPTIIFEGVEFKGSKFKLHARQFKLATSSSLLTVYEKEDYLNAHRRILKAVPATYYPQVYKILNGMEIEAHDRVFYYEHELCEFLNPVELLK